METTTVTSKWTSERTNCRHGRILHKLGLVARICADVEADAWLECRLPGEIGAVVEMLEVLLVGKVLDTANQGDTREAGRSVGAANVPNRESGSGPFQEACRNAVLVVHDPRQQIDLPTRRRGTAAKPDSHACFQRCDSRKRLGVGSRDSAFVSPRLTVIPIAFNLWIHWWAGPCLGGCKVAVARAVASVQVSCRDEWC